MERLSKIFSCSSFGLEPLLVEVEVDVGAGLPSLTIVGLPDKAVEESKERVRLALKNSGFDFPQKKIVVNLAPADVKKEGPSFDLPIAVGVLVAAGYLNAAEIKDIIFLGELSLGGGVRQVKGVIQAAILAKKLHFPLVAPQNNSTEANLISNLKIFPVDNLKNLALALSDKSNSPFTPSSGVKVKPKDDFGEYDFANIVGQSQAKRALEIASAGSHNILLEGPPGGGKTLLSRSIVSILPPLTEDEILEVTKIYSVAGLLTEDQPVIVERPFRSPHHTTSSVAVIGGGSYPKPGEVSLAHRGVLFLDEFPEFPRSVLEALRQPLEDKVVTVSRAQSTIHFPADFILVAAKNPCPCGFFGDEKQDCKCTTAHLLSYQRKISGPLLDRIDLHLTVGKVPTGKIVKSIKEEPSSAVRARVIKARQLQVKRGKLNNLLTKKELENRFPLSDKSQKMLEGAVDDLDLSMRSLVKIWRLGRTIADLEGSPEIQIEHLSEALQYRPKKERLL